MAFVTGAKVKSTFQIPSKNPGGFRKCPSALHAPACFQVHPSAVVARVRHGSAVLLVAVPGAESVPEAPDAEVAMPDAVPEAVPAVPVAVPEAEVPDAEAVSDAQAEASVAPAEVPASAPTCLAVEQSAFPAQDAVVQPD